MGVRVDFDYSITYGDLTPVCEVDPVIVYNYRRKIVHRIIKCLCKCGNTTLVRTGNLKNGSTKSCGCRTNKDKKLGYKIALPGQKYDRLTVIKDVESGGKYRKVLCVCECGKEITISVRALTDKNKTSSCGCLNKEPKIKNRSENYPYKNHRLYGIWSDIKKRCYNKNCRAYKWYGAEGKTMCDEWKNRFISFYNWSIANGYEDSLTIDRKDPSGNYEPSNCRWIPWSEQNNNKRNSRLINYKGKKMSIKDASILYNINYITLTERLNRGWSVDDAIEFEPNKCRNYAAFVSR